MAREWEHLTALRELVGRPHVVEVLEALRGGPMTVAEMGSTLPRSRRNAGQVIRDLMLAGLVAGSTAGSRDDPPAGERYQHTERGRDVVRMLSSYAVWVSLHDQPGAVPYPAP